MSDAPHCPLCDAALRGWAETTAADGAVTAVHDCPTCGLYAVRPDLRPLLDTLTPAARWSLVGRLELHLLPAGPAGVVVLTPDDLVP